MLFKINDELTVQFRFIYYKEDNIRYTLVEVYDKNWVKISYGLARCSPKDNFSKVKGRKVALQHLIKKLTEDKRWNPIFGDRLLRKCFWDEYFQWTNYHKVIGKGE